MQNAKPGDNKDALKYRSYKYSIRIIRFIGSLPNRRIFWVLGDQLLRSGTSIGSNIIEAQAASSKKDFTKYFNISLKSANESKYWLCLFRDGTNADKNIINDLLKETTEIAKILGASLLTLKRRDNF